MSWRSILPGLSLLTRYERSWLRADLLAGLTVGAMLVPQSMAYAELAGLPPSAGFFAALLPPVAYALVGSSRHLGVGPEPGTAVLAATGVAALSAGDPARYMALMPTLALLVGAIALLGAALRMGFLAQLLSKPVLVGYITGVGMTLLSSQLGKFTGAPVAGDQFFTRAWSFARSLDGVQPVTLALSGAGLALLLALRRWAPKLPGALIVVTLSTLVAWLGHLDARGVRLVGTIHGALPTLSLPALRLADLVALLPTALGIVLVGYTDNVLTARSIAAKRGYTVDANQELAGLGVVNLASAIAGGFPVSSSASRTAVPASLGSRTQLVGLVASGFLLATLLLIAPALSMIPQSALAVVIVAAAIAIIDVAGYRWLWGVSRIEFSVAVATALSVMVFDLLTGVLLAVGLSGLVAFARVALPHDAVLTRAEGLDGWVDSDRYQRGTSLPGLLVFRFDAPLFFANSARFRERLEVVLERNPGEEEWVLLDFEGVGAVDATAIEMLSELIRSLREKNIVVAIARANDRALTPLQRAGLVSDGALRVFETINRAVREFEASRTSDGSTRDVSAGKSAEPRVPLRP